MPKKTIRDVEVAGKRVLVRVDFNVPLAAGEVADDTRIQQALPTIRNLLSRGARVILLTHLGRPHDCVAPEYRVDPVAARLAELLGQKVFKADDCVGAAVQKMVAALADGEILILENTRFHAAEKNNDGEFAAQLASLGELFVQDAFGVLHRDHASVTGIARHLPTVAGLLVKKEIDELSKLFHNPARPLLLILGGAKIDTKIGVLKKFVELADTIVVGGGIANTFLAAEGFEVGSSLYEADKLELAREILQAAAKNNCHIELPTDVVVADAEVVLTDDTPALDFAVTGVPPGTRILDVGIVSRIRLKELIAAAGTIVWNGPVGLFEFAPFALGTRVIAESCATARHALTLLGGGDTIKALRQFGLAESEFSHVSTGGGAMLELLEGKQLPGLEVLQKTERLLPKTGST